MSMDPGKYHGTLKSGVVTVSQAKKTPQFALVFDVTHWWDGAAWQALNPSVERTMYLAMSDGAWEYSERKLKTLGFDENFESPGFDPEVMNQGVELLCAHENYEGKIQERWELANWGGSANLEPAPSDVVRMIAAKWKARNGGNGAHRASAPPKPAPARRATAPAPAPAPSTATSATTGILTVATRDEAWAEVLTGQKNGENQARVAWAIAIEKVAKRTGKGEADFGPDEWTAVAADGSIPF